MMLSNLAAAALHRVGAALGTGQASLADAERVCRFLSGHLEFAPRPTDVYVATYPRSGTTWVQFILYLIKSGRKIDFEHISQVSPWFERSLALGTKRASDFEAFAEPRCFKTHLTPEWLPKVGRVVYIERQPFDVALSYYHLYRSHLGYRGTFADFFDRFLRGDLQYRSWFDHVARWRAFADQHPQRVLSLRYEDMVADLRPAVRDLARFIEVVVTNEDVDEIVHLASFSTMRTRQKIFDPITEMLLDNGLHENHFIRAGRQGEGDRQLTDEQRSRFAAVGRARRRPRFGEWRIHDFLH